MQKVKEAERRRFPLIDKIGSDISSSEDELLTGEDPKRSPVAAPPEPERDQDNLEDDQVFFHLISDESDSRAAWRIFIIEKKLRSIISFTYNTTLFFGSE